MQRSVDPAIYRQRNLVERFFNKLKHFRKIATLYEKSTQNYLAAVLIACTRLWANIMSPRPRAGFHNAPKMLDFETEYRWNATVRLHRYNKKMTTCNQT